MTIGAGARLGPYEILTPIGAGGMGEVYRAKDTRLDRTVAIKVLPAHSADNPEQRQRLDREAHAIAALTHPHICTLHDIGHQDGVDYLVMEYLDGETLAARLTKGPLPLDQVLRYSIEIADALDKAHRAGIVHRDLKPGNVMLTKAGASSTGSLQAKLLDFGLAKATPAGLRPIDANAGLQSGPAITSLPTSPASLTAKGMILGTLQYMAPEQLEGKDADARTDIFALGTVIYEMATGKKAFSGESQASLIAAILDATPPAISTLQPLTPSALDHVVTTCLAKDPDERWQTAGDVKRQLKWIADADSQAGAILPVPVRRKTRDRIAGMAIGLLVGAIAIGALDRSLLRSSTPTPRPVVRSTISLPPENTTEEFVMIALSPDGTHLVYAGDDGLYVRALDQFAATPIPGTEDASSPFFSPDGRWVGFFSDRTLKKVPLTGGTPTTICKTIGIFGGSWGPDDTIVFNTGTSSGLSRVSASGGTPQVLTTPDRTRREKVHKYPEILPGGKAVIFTSSTADIASFDDARIEVLSLTTRARHVLIEGAMFARYAPTGHLVYARAGALFAVPFDLTRLEVTGTPTEVVDGVITLSTEGLAVFAFSHSGSLAYASGAPDKTAAAATLRWVDRHGATQPITNRRDNFGQIRLSPDGQRVAMGIIRASNEIWTVDIARDTVSRLVFGWNNSWPVWTPDGSRIAFQSDRAGEYNLYWQLADGSGPAERLTTSAHVQVPWSWSPDGHVLAFTELDPANRFDIWTLRLDGDRQPRPFLHEVFEEQVPMFSPDGRWLAYRSDETGRAEIYVRPYPGPGGKWQISNEGGDVPRWARNGRELFFRSGDNLDRLMTVTVTLGGAFSATKPRLLVQPFPGNWSYDVSPDGQRFAVISEEPRRPATQINLVLNWFEELKRRVPTGR